MDAVAPFDIDVPALSRGVLDRSEDIRPPAVFLPRWAAARVVPVTRRGEIPVIGDGPRMRLATRDTRPFGPQPPPDAVLVGRLGDLDHWAVTVPDADAAGTPADTASPAGWHTVRNAGALLDDDDASIATTAVALLAWHARAAYCTRCGRPMRPEPAGHSRRCADGHQEFPRTDPAIIVLVYDDDGNVVLGRQASWDPGRYSVLAGFTEAGESLEATVAREVHEEVGITVSDVAYLGSQPWPFPRSLMVAFAARAPHTPLRPRPGELDDAAWFTPTRLAAAVRGRDEPDGRAPNRPITLPGPVSIARRMIEGFLRGR